MRSFPVLLIVHLLLGISAASQPLPPIIPMPERMAVASGYFTIDASTSVSYDASNAPLRSVAVLFTTAIREISGFTLPVNRPSGRSIELRLDRPFDGGEEGYRMTVTPSKISIVAGTQAGIFYGMQSLLQTLPSIRINAVLQVACMTVEDRPRFRWRGLHLDVSRHFFGPEVIRQYIDLMARYKMNRFHWHLTDDQGWRIEIRKYPELTRTGAWRVDHTDMPWAARPQARPGERPAYGGFYTQQQLRELVSYARDRNVVIVPEIEMPGHSAAALASYPQLGCTGKPQLPLTGGDYAGMSSSFCAGNDSVFTFLGDILGEVMDIFPSEYIHIGGDEVDKGPWKSCAKCQARMLKEHLGNEEALQSWFIRRIEAFIVARRRKMVGWDEILEGGLAPTATVMSWRGEAGGIEAAKMGHDVVMTPGSPCYFDHYQAGPEGEPRAIGGMNTLRKVYEYEPIPEALRGDLAKYVLGAQANVWTEFITTPEHLEYMILPRMPALAEVLWSPVAARDWTGFSQRLQAHFKTYEQRGYRYSKGNFKVDIRPTTVDGKLVVALATEAMDGTIYYTVDGSEPTVTSNRYFEPFELQGSATVKAVTVVKGEVMGVRPAEQAFVFHEAVGGKVSYLHPMSRSYQASGMNALVDGVRGLHAVGKYWHGFDGKDLVATIDLGTVKNISRIALGCMQRYADWIFMPQWVRFETSLDGVHFTEIATVPNTIDPGMKESVMHDFSAGFALREVKFVRITAKAIDGCPKGHPGAGKPAWIFADEVVVQ